MNEERSGQILVIRRVWRSELLRVVLFFISCLVVIELSKMYPGTVVTGELISFGERTFFLSLPLLWFLPLGIVGQAIINIYDARYELSHRGIESREGILGLHQRITRICYEDIRSVETDQTLLERFLNIGSIDIGTAATGMADITMTGVGSPKEIQEIVQAERDRRQNAATPPESEPFKATA